MIKNLIFDFGKVLVDYDYFIVLDKIFATREQAEDFYRHLMAEKWNERLDWQCRSTRRKYGSSATDIQILWLAR